MDEQHYHHFQFCGSFQQKFHVQWCICLSFSTELSRKNKSNNGCKESHDLNLSEYIQTYLQHGQTIFKSVHPNPATCRPSSWMSDIIISFWPYLNLFEPFWTYLNLSEPIWTYLGLSEHIPTWSNNVKNVCTLFALLAGHHHGQATLSSVSDPIWPYLNLSEPI